MGFLKRRIRKLLLRLLKPLFDELSMGTHRLYGSTERLKISPNALVTNTLFNTYSGEIMIGENVFTGHNVSMITGAHNYNLKNLERMAVEPKEGNDIIIENGVWIGSNVVIIGPCNRRTLCDCSRSNCYQKYSNRRYRWRYSRPSN